MAEPNDIESGDDLAKQVKTLSREIKLLNKKLLRSEANRDRAEKMKDETDALYENVLHQVEVQKQAIENAQARLNEAFEVISSSITYAARIQRSVLPDVSILDAVTQDHFVLWEPRDRVGGDMYWVGAWGEGCLVILADCTGHGVPGAFMTLIVIGALERALKEVPAGKLGHLIARVHQFVQVSLGQHYERDGSDDGLELGGIFFEMGAPQFTFVGARFDLFQVIDGEIYTVKGTKAGLGYRGIPYAQAYEEVKVPHETGAQLYLKTDGYTDQVGGENRRMFGNKRFKALLLEIQDCPMAEQKQRLEKALLDYQGAEGRRDDVSIIGFQI